MTHVIMYQIHLISAMYELTNFIFLLLFPKFNVILQRHRVQHLVNISNKYSMLSHNSNNVLNIWSIFQIFQSLINISNKCSMFM